MTTGQAGMKMAQRVGKGLKKGQEGRGRFGRFFGRISCTIIRSSFDATEGITAGLARREWDVISQSSRWDVGESSTSLC